jgi:uncharacterized protein YjbJ (UPF0337 family)
MALDPRSAARTAVLTPVGLGVLAADRTADWATGRAQKANAAIRPRVEPVRHSVTTKVKSLLEDARAEAKPAADQLEQRLAALSRRRNGVGPAAKTTP